MGYSAEITLEGKAQHKGGFNRNGFEYTVRGFNELQKAVRFLRYAGQEQKEDHKWEGWEATAETIESLLIPKEKCRIILDYDPAEKKISVYHQSI